MLTKEQFSEILSQGPLLLDGATGSNLQKMGMPRGCCSEEWILANPDKLITHRFELKDVSKAYALMASGRCGKVAVVYPD